MDATFDTNDVKFHLFTLMVFDAHHTKMSVACLVACNNPCNRYLNPFLLFLHVVHILRYSLFELR